MERAVDRDCVVHSQDEKGSQPEGKKQITCVGLWPGRQSPGCGGIKGKGFRVCRTGGDSVVSALCPGGGKPLLVVGSERKRGKQVAKRQYSYRWKRVKMNRRAATRPPPPSAHPQGEALRNRAWEATQGPYPCSHCDVLETAVFNNEWKASSHPYRAPKGRN